MGAQTHGVNSSKWWEGKLKSAAVNNYKCEGMYNKKLWYHEAARCSFFSNKHALCSSTCIQKIFIHKLEIFLDGYASLKFIPH